MEVVSNVSEGGVITTYIGDEDTDEHAIKLSVEDPGAVLHDYLKSEAVNEILFGAGFYSPNQVTGSVDKERITHSLGYTELPIDIPAAAKANASPRDDYRYHVKAYEESGGNVFVEGQLRLRPERAKRPV